MKVGFFRPAFFFLLRQTLDVPMHNAKSIITNKNIPVCRNCVFYKPDIYGDDFSSRYSKCGKFGEKNILTGKITYKYVDICRENETLCGKEGKYFEKEEQINWKLMKYIVIKNVPYGILVLPFFFILLVSNLYPGDNPGEIK